MEAYFRRLKGKAKGVMLLGKGIYVIFDDKAGITYEEFVEMNSLDIRLISVRIISGFSS